jgi:hypothetical protein
MPTARSLPLFGRTALLAAAVLLAAGIANAQTASDSGSSHAASASTGESSSTDYLALVNDPAPATPDAPASAGAGQYENTGGGGTSGGILHKLTFEVGGGFNSPISDTSNYLNLGWQFGVGGGMRFRHGLSLLIDYQFMRDGLPSSLIAQTGASGGYAHIWSFTMNPVLDLMPKHPNSVYVTGGGGFYRKVTNFTNLTPTQFCSYFYCGIGYVPQTVGHFSSNQGGWSIGGGFEHKFTGMYGEGHTAIFAEVRYLDILSPAVDQSPNGLGNAVVGAGTKLLPVNFGFRF